jgi:taurine dioxygenase
VRENAGLGSGEVVWHSDNSYIEKPPAGSMLYAIDIPDGGGGDTSFANQYLAYESLPKIMRIAVQGKLQLHDSSRNSAGVLRPTAKLPTTPEEVEGPVHPLVRIHPATRKKALYLGRRRIWPSNYILGMPNERSEALLDRLWRHATQDDYTWTHKWRPGDVMLWDNRCAMHHRTEVNHAHPRILHRTQIQGETVIPG